MTTSNSGVPTQRNGNVMAFSTRQSDDEHVLVHQFIRMFGRRPEAHELALYRAAPSRTRRRVLPRVRRRTAHRAGARHA